MDREQARQEIRAGISCTDYLEKSKNGMYCCPNIDCTSGHGKNGTGAVKYYRDTNTWYCHSCGKGGDVIDLYQLTTGADYNTALSLMAQQIGITIDTYQPAAATGHTERTERRESGEGGATPAESTNAAKTGAETPTEAHADYFAYYEECRKRLDDPAAIQYLQSRGISKETAAAYWIGYDPAADPAQSNHPCPRIIIPTSAEHYIGRRIDGIKDFAKLNAKGSTPDIFNKGALRIQDVQEVFVTEGAFDALSIIEAGYTAIALNSTSNTDKLIEVLEQRRTDATLILCPDNDPDPKTADRVKKKFAELAAGLNRLNISNITADINGDYKDANEHLTGDKTAFIKSLERAKRQAADKPDNIKNYIDTIFVKDIDRFRNDKKTGFNNLDEKAGGLYSGLYVLAAISSLGKTSFALQMADQLAQNGHDVIFFSLEQSRFELVTKSIARRTAQADKNTAVTSLAIRKGYIPEQVKNAITEYKTAVADRLSIVEGNFACNVSFIGNYIRQYMRRNETTPIVFIDYLQILQPADDAKRQSTKEAIDSAVTELKRLSRELDLTIVVISSVNRANYLTPIDFESLKESGGVEYTCDVVWGLQLQCLNQDPLFESIDKKNDVKKRDIVKKEKAATPRKIELTCLKNRYGISNYSCFFNYYPANDLFEESGEPGTSAVHDFKNAKRI